MEYMIEDLTKEETGYIGEKSNGIGSMIIRESEANSRTFRKDTAATNSTKQ